MPQSYISNGVVPHRHVSCRDNVASAMKSICLPREISATLFLNAARSNVDLSIHDQVSIAGDAGTPGRYGILQADAEVFEATCITGMCSMLKEFPDGEKNEDYEDSPFKEFFKEPLEDPFILSRRARARSSSTVAMAMRWRCTLSPNGVWPGRVVDNVLLIVNSNGNAEE